MRSRILIGACLLSILTVVPVFGETLGSVSIPFEFAVGKQAMPAGKYDFVRQTASDTTLTLRNIETGRDIRVHVITRLSHDVGSSKKGARVVFDSVGQKKYLSEFWPSDGDDGYLLQATRQNHTHKVVQ